MIRKKPDAPGRVRRRHPHKGATPQRRKGRLPPEAPWEATVARPSPYLRGKRPNAVCFLSGGSTGQKPKGATPPTVSIQETQSGDVKKFFRNFLTSPVAVTKTAGKRNYAWISATTPEPTVRPPSRIAKRSPFSQAIGAISSTIMLTLSPGRHISTPSGRLIEPVTSVVLK